MRIQKSLAAGLFAAMLTLSSCSFSPTAQKGYGYVKEDIKASLYVPSSYKGENVSCYFNIKEIYSYQYKVIFSAENAFGGRVSYTVYYGYNDGNDKVRNYGSDSSSYSEASRVGEKKDVTA